MKSVMPKAITATEAARRFSDLLDDVEHRGAHYVIVRRGRRIAALSPHGTGPSGVTFKEWLELRRRGPQPDAAFADDVRRFRRELNRPPDDPWVRSSTRRS